MTVVIRDETERKAVDPDLSVGDLCRGSLEEMLVDSVDTKRFTVLHEGSVYYFDLSCVAIKPPYNMAKDDTDEKVWYGQRLS
jgi:hypothetical protein